MAAAGSGAGLSGGARPLRRGAGLPGRGRLYLFIKYKSVGGMKVYIGLGWGVGGRMAGAEH